MSPTRFAELLGDPEAATLDELTLSISATLQGGALRGGLDEIEWLAALDQLAGECPSPTPAGIARHLFDDAGFRGNRRAYYHWHNSCLDHVLATRTGIPITLSVVMLEVGRRLGVTLEGVGMPAHFLVRVGGDPDQLFDPFDGGRRLDPDGARALLARATEGQVAWHDHFLDATPTRDIVIRVLNNLKGVLAARGDRLRLALLMQLRAVIPELRANERPEIDAASSVFN
jgi:regulator of sirC expression with transglutaminase-like and TPR domain